MDPKKKKIVVAMSGGVDSSVAAAILADQGYDVVGVTLRLLKKGATGFGCCGNPEDTAIAKRTAERIGIPHYVLDYSPEFEKSVVNYFVDSYLDGETPNPCLACNRYIKFDKLKTFAHKLDATYLASGHYARIIHKNNHGKDSYHLFEAVDSSKDQSYVLYNASASALETTLFPVGDRPKPEIRSMAEKFGLINADKKDSQEICFVPNRDYASFVKINIEERGLKESKSVQPGHIKNHEGKVIGEHKGVAFYTVGQRKGLGLTTPEPYYVTKLDSKTNTVVVGPDKRNLSEGLIANDICWTQGTPPDTSFEALVKIRYKHDPAPARVTVRDGKFEVKFSEPQRAVTPGQAAVIYRVDEEIKAKEVIGGGKITSPINS